MHGNFNSPIIRDQLEQEGFVSLEPEAIFEGWVKTKQMNYEE